jgi:hypothetical protein
VSPNVAWSGSMESYHPYLQAKKVSNFPKIECIHSGLPKTAKSHFGRLGPLGVKRRRYWIVLEGMLPKNFIAHRCMLSNLPVFDTNGET